MARIVCELCQNTDDILNMGMCLRDHPDSTKRIIGTEDGQPVIMNDSGKQVKFKDIDSENLNQTLLFKATVMSITDIANYDIQKVYKCIKCGHTIEKNMNDYREIYDKDSITPCPSCESAPCIIDRKYTITGNIMKILLQETNDESSVNPRRIEAHLTSKNVFKLIAGKDYMFQANLWSISYGKKENLNRFVLDVLKLKCLDEDTSLMPTPTEIEFLRNHDKKLVVESLAPELIYRSNEKMAAIISYLSGGRVDGIRGDMSVLYCGDPSTGKSQILNALHSLDGKSYKISGRSTSAAGMVMGVDNLPDGTRMATFGPVILAHNHFVCIDEGDKMKPEDRSMLHDVMEDEVAHLNKVGINLTMPAQTKIIMAANPKSSKYDKDATIMSNIGMPDSFVARFGYVFLVLDNFTMDEERKKLRRINYIKIFGKDKLIESEGFLTHDSLVKYLNYAKSLNPVFQPEALIKLEDLYIDLKFRVQKKDSIAIDTRAYHDIIRASYSFARFRFSNKVEILDVNMAWNLYTEALKSFGMNTMGEFRDTQLASRDSDKQQWIDETLNKVSINKTLNLDLFKLELLSRVRLVPTLQAAQGVIDELIREGVLLGTTEKGVMRYNG